MTVARRVALALTVLVAITVVLGIVAALTGSRLAWFSAVVSATTIASLVLRAWRVESQDLYGTTDPDVFGTRSEQPSGPEEDRKPPA